MEQRALGRSGLKIAPLMFGGNVFGWTADKERSFALLDAFADAGFNGLDTADAYARWLPGSAGGESETIIGEWLATRKSRRKIVLATKLGMDLGEGRKGLSKGYIVQAVEASLKRLQTDYIDLYQAHADDVDTPLEETLEAFAGLIKAGKVRAIGASNYSPTRLKAALDVSAGRGLPRYESLQPPYNLYDRAGFEAALGPLCKREGLGVITYYSLASGFLSGKYRAEADIKGTSRAHATKKYLNPRGLRILDRLDRTAKDLNATPAQVALAWLMAKPGITAPIVSATSLPQLQDILGAVRLRLDADTLRVLDAASALD